MIREAIASFKELAKNMAELSRHVVALTTAVASNNNLLREMRADVSVTREKVEQIYSRHPQPNGAHQEGS